MGCLSSNISNGSDESSYGLYMPLRLKPRKRFFSSRITSSDKKNYAKLVRYSSSSTDCSKTSPTNVPSKPPMKTQLLQQQSERIQFRTLERSFGHHSGSTDDPNSSWNTFSCSSMLLNTQDMSTSSVESHEAPQCDEPVSNTCNLQMEILMIRENVVMPNTSSPIGRRRGVPFTNYINYTPPTNTYCRWRKNLHEASPKLICDITSIPEAVSGQFGPLTHPAYIDYKDDFEYVRGPKRYRVDS